MTFYLKYRGQTLDEIDLEEVRKSLKSIVAAGKIPHAFLFSGPKGTGKTSAARILAKILNCDPPSPRLRKSKEPCNKCDQCVSITKGNNLDVIELDAASHRGIDDVRALRDAVKLAPVAAQKKIYIIDEAHMLTTEASNALLKTLEEPPEHVFFILATTNPEKLIETIRSRTTQVFFRKAKDEEIVRSLERIVKGEKIKIKKEDLGLIAKAAHGSFRDAAKTLEQASLELKSFAKDKIEEFLFKTRTFNIREFLNTLAGRETARALEEIEEVVKKGDSIQEVTEMVLLTLQASLLSKMGVASGPESRSAPKALQRRWLRPGGPAFSKDDLLYLIDLFSKAATDLKTAVIEQLPLEVAVVKWCEGEGRAQSTRLDLNSPPDKIGTSSASSRSPASPAKQGTSTLDSASPSLAQTVSPGASGHAPTPAIKELGEEVWKKILLTIRPINASIEALLRASRPVDFDGSILTLGVFYKFHKERLEETPNKRVLEDVVAQILGTSVRVVCILTEPPLKVPINKEPVLTEGEDRDIIKVAEEIFGS